ncbi:DUF3127 domain-containing protein [Saprospiraceae bacterium]|nr:DUF3127 domain-containing protein [Saprospiraceae bacterium]
MSFEISGKVVKIFDIESKTESFQAREFVIETANDRYPQMIKFQLTQDRCSVVDNYKEGEEIKVFFDLRGREWNGKYFTNLNAWKVEAAAPMQNAPVSAPPAAEGGFPTEDPFSGTAKQETTAEDFDDLPF